MPEEMPCYLSGLHDTAVSRPYGNNASAFGSMGRREAEREKEGWGLAPVASTRSVSHSDRHHIEIYPVTPPKTSTPPHYTQRHRNGAYGGADRLHLYITRLFYNAVSLTKVLTTSNERGSSCVVDTGLTINGPDLFNDITSISALKQYDTSGQPA